MCIRAFFIVWQSSQLVQHAAWLFNSLWHCAARVHIHCSYVVVAFTSGSRQQQLSQSSGSAAYLLSAHRVAGDTLHADVRMSTYAVLQQEQQSGDGI
jgi:hypothetical protein